MSFNLLFIKGTLIRHPLPNRDGGTGVGMIDRAELEAFLQKDGRGRKR